jgi:hypothetical protein
VDDILDLKQMSISKDSDDGSDDDDDDERKQYQDAAATPASKPAPRHRAGIKHKLHQDAAATSGK